MRKRYEAALSLLPTLKFEPFHALRSVRAEGYDRTKLRKDLLAGVVVGIVALPLSMALAIASGVPPQHGLYTAIVAGGLIALLGGSRTQVSGPTAAFVVMLAPISAKYGLGGLLVATMMAGVLLMAFGLARLGRLIEFIPYPVTTGFTAGIATVIATLQLKDFFGLTTAPLPEHFVEKVEALARAAPTAQWESILIGALTLAVLLVWPRITTRVPAPLIALATAAVAAAVLARLVPGFELDTIGTRFSYESHGVTHSGIPREGPSLALPWLFAGPDGKPLALSWALLRELFPAAFAIAMLGAIESLLSAVVADGMVGTRHDPDTELFAQGVGNFVAPFFGGFAATGAIARTATNIRAGAISPVAGVTHAVFVLLAVLLLAPALAALPMAALAALLLIVARNMAETKHFMHVLRVAPKSDVTVLLACFTLTVLFDMVVAVTVGIVLAALLFMRRMAEITGSHLAEGEHPATREKLPKGVVVYDIAGPLFFGAAHKAMSSLHEISGHVRIVILNMAAVPAMDATGLVNLESALARLRKDRDFVYLAGVQPQPARVLERGGICSGGGLEIVSTLEEAIRRARELPARPPTGSAALRRSA